VGKASGTGKCNDFSPVSSLGVRGIVNRFPCCCARDLHNGLLKLALHLPPNQQPRSLNGFISKQLAADGISRNQLPPWIFC
jgi:hypothetical protein